MNKYRCDDGNAEVEIYAETARDAAQEYVDDGDWGEVTGTKWITVYVQQVDDDGNEIGDRERIKIALEPDEPSCIDSRGDDHDWRSPIELVGGCRENPGVYGHGGGVIITEVCMYCGTERTVDTWAQDRSDGEQGLESVRYEEGKFADEVRPEYRYQVVESINAGQALISVDAYQLGERVAGAMFVVTDEGEIECDTQSDGCESNPFDDGWPAPPQEHVDEAIELATAAEGV